MKGFSKANQVRGIPELMRLLADYLENNEIDELVKFLRRPTSKAPVASQKIKSKLHFDDLKGVATSLQSLADRADGESLLRERRVGRKDLESLARYLQLPVQRDDTIDRLTAKIIENTIGSRLRSEAIQGIAKPDRNKEKD